MSLDYKIIGNRLKDARISKNLTQERLAEIIDVSVAYISRVETGNVEINLKRLSQICSVLDITMGAVLDGTTYGTKNYLNNDFSSLLKNCPSDKLQLIYNIAQIIVKDKRNEQKVHPSYLNSLYLYYSFPWQVFFTKMSIISRLPIDRFS